MKHNHRIKYTYEIPWYERLPRMTDGQSMMLGVFIVCLAIMGVVHG